MVRMMADQDPESMPGGKGQSELPLQCRRNLLQMKRMNQQTLTLKISKGKKN